MNPLHNGASLALALAGLGAIATAVAGSPAARGSRARDVVLDIQNRMRAASCFDDFTVSHVEGYTDDDGHVPEEIRVRYTLVDGRQATFEEMERLFADFEKDYGLSVKWSGPTGNGFGIVWMSKG